MSSTSLERLSRRKPKENQEGDIYKTFKELCQIEMLKTNIGKGKKTSNQEVEGEARGMKPEDSFNVELDCIVNGDIDIFQVGKNVTSQDLQLNLMSKCAWIQMKLGIKIKHEEKIM